MQDLERSVADHEAALAASNDAGLRADQAIVDAGATDLPGRRLPRLPQRRRRPRTPTRPGCQRLGGRAGGHRPHQLRRTDGTSAPAIDDLGRVSPALRGLQGVRTADTDQGAVDGDAGADRAVGPMQLAPAVWTAFAADGDGDGRTDPDDLFDAALTTAGALCSWGTALDVFDTARRRGRGAAG